MTATRLAIARVPLEPGRRLRHLRQRHNVLIQLPPWLRNRSVRPKRVTVPALLSCRVC